MNPAAVAPSPAWEDAVLAVSFLAVDPRCGATVRSAAGPVRDRWLTLLRELLSGTMPLRRIPLQISDARLLGGLDLAATLQARRPVADRGLLAEASGGIVVLAMAERISSTTAAHITSVMDTEVVVLERDGLTLRTDIQVGVVAFDEGLADEERPPEALMDRLAFHLDLTDIRVREAIAKWHDATDIAAARERLHHVTASDEMLKALCETALALGIESIRAPLLALRVARVAAALDGRSEVSLDDAVLAGRLVLAPRAVTLPMSDPAEQEPEEESDDPSDPPPDNPDTPDPPEDPDKETPPQEEPNLEDLVLAATQAAIPAGLLARLAAARDRSSRSRSIGRAGELRYSGLRGRPAGVRRGQPRAGARLNVVETLRAAAPWQRLRGRDFSAQPTSMEPARIEVRLDDFHVSRFKQRTETTTIFVVDASGSSALHRLAEAKGAVELLLAESYVRRDRVAVLAFRGRAAEILLPPTRSLVRAKRSLAALPGGGGTPLASAIDAATALADSIRRRGGTPTVVLLTDGRGNIARDGAPGRERANEDALSAARIFRITGVRALLVDTSPSPQALAQRLAGEMGAQYLALPYADARRLSTAVQRSMPAQPQ